jgi:AcrR family transcriptional regulator
MSAAPVRTRERQRQQTRTLILEAGLEEIAREGLAGAKIEHIARRAGVTRPTVYAHFARKEDFLLALQDRMREGVVGELLERVADARGAEVAHRLTDALYDLIATVDPELRRESLALVVREPQELDWSGDPLFDLLVAGLADAQARGEIARRVPAAAIARSLVPAFLGVLVFENVPLEDRRQLTHNTVDLMLGSA